MSLHFYSTLHDFDPVCGFGRSGYLGNYDE